MPDQSKCQDQSQCQDQSKCRPTLERDACSKEVAALKVPASPFSLFCRTIASQHRPSARLEVPADEGKNRSSGGEHLSVGGEQQTLQRGRRDWLWAPPVI